MNILLAAVLGGLFVSDSTAAGQTMISRPIFCAPVIGWLAGDIYTGLMVGVIMELVWINVIPLGNAVPPDATVVAVSAAYLGAISPAGDYGFVAFCILCLIPMGIIFKKLDIIHREYNSYLSGEIEEKIRKNDVKAVDRGVYMGWLFFILKGALFLAGLIFAGRALFADLYAVLGENARRGLNTAFFMLPAVGLGSVITTFIFKKSKRK